VSARRLRRPDPSPASARHESADGGEPPAAVALATRADAIEIAQWLAAIAAAGLAVWTTRGGAHHQLAIAVLSALICAFVGLAAVELVARLTVAAVLRSRDDPARRGGPPDK